MSIKFYFAIFICVSVGVAQQIKVNIKDLSEIHVELYSLEGENISLLDTIFAGTGSGSNIQIDSQNLTPGFYRLIFGKSKFFDFIFDGKDVSLETDANNILDSMKVLSSESNRLFYEFIKLNKKYKTKSELLQLILARYPKDDDYYETTKKRIAKLQLDYLKFVDETSQADPESFITRYIRSAQLPVLDFTLQAEEQINYLKEHSFDNVDFTDTQLIYSDLFTNKTIEYLTYYRNPQLPKELLEKEFLAATDKILDKAKVNQLVYQQIVDYLIDGFKKFGFDLVLDHIVENYVVKDDLCLDEATENSIQKRVDQAQKLSVGTVVPNIILSDSNGVEIDLSKIENEKVVIIFYASWCPHCKELIPKLKKVYESQDKKEFQVLAISLDSDSNEWLDFIRKNSTDWLNVNAPEGWESKVANDFFIYATPTIFVVDREKKIMEKPLKIEELMLLL